jgi:hypothetical protein
MHPAIHCKFCKYGLPITTVHNIFILFLPEKTSIFPMRSHSMVCPQVGPKYRGLYLLMGRRVDDDGQFLDTIR